MCKGIKKKLAPYWRIKENWRIEENVASPPSEHWLCKANPLEVSSGAHWLWFWEHSLFCRSAFHCYGGMNLPSVFFVWCIYTILAYQFSCSFYKNKLHSMKFTEYAWFTKRNRECSLCKANVHLAQSIIQSCASKNVMWFLLAVHMIRYS